jgi:D-threo-aldose 1-dehydrogenase
VLVGGATYNYETVPPHIVDRVNSIKRVCNSHNIPMASAALQFPLKNPLISSVIPGPRTVTELKATLDWYELDIPDSLWSDLKNEGLMRPEAPTS